MRAAAAKKRRRRPPAAKIAHITKDLRDKAVSLRRLKLDAENPRIHDERNLREISGSLGQFLQVKPIVLARDGKTVLAGNGTVEAARDMGWEWIAAVRSHLEPDSIYRVADNRTTDLSTFDDRILAEILRSAESTAGSGYSQEELDAIIGAAGGADGPQVEPGAKLVDRFLVPPFSVLDSRQGYWMDRKRAWLSLGIRSESHAAGAGMLITSESGRDPTFYRQKQEAEARLNRKLETGEFIDNHYKDPQQGGGLSQFGVSVFDPVLCELAYRWFSPPGGLVIDPFAGGSVRGVVAAACGRRYIGTDLREDQVEANRENWKQIVGGAEAETRITDPEELTPIEKRGPIWMKRDDLLEIAGVRGGKVRTCWALAKGAKGLVTAGSRSSPQANIVAHVAQELGVPCRVHTPQGELSEELLAAQAAGAEVVQHPAGYNNVIIARAREDAKETGWTEIPFGMECEEAVRQTARQVENLPREAKRIVVPVGSGMSLAGIATGIADVGIDIPILGVCVGADPKQRLETYAKCWSGGPSKLVKAEIGYDWPAPETCLEGVILDEIYEAKVIPWLEPGDLLWCVGIRQTQRSGIEIKGAQEPTWLAKDGHDIADDVGLADGADLLFTCPPYGDLERYSDDPRDLSTMKAPKFRKVYRAIIAAACEQLREDRFAVVVVGNYRDSVGNMVDLSALTVEAFKAGGLDFYNDAIFVTPISSVAVRAPIPFTRSRKLGKTHQYVMVFVKGDPTRAAEACGAVELAAEEQ